jgi:hypothetical protein
VNELDLLKRDLQMTTSANDNYLSSLLEAAKSYMKREGIIETDTIEYLMTKVHYAAYLFRKRSSKETSMPRFLRFELNNLLFSQKAS